MVPAVGYRKWFPKLGAQRAAEPLLSGSQLLLCRTGIRMTALFQIARMQQSSLLRGDLLDQISPSALPHW
ncbi:hypothetical protein NSK11_contig00063-0023 [Nocardia seriolae]|uniref:Uncharacterized protein n=1 Tax=Nocardia seriolae TaxID=37332 RepID=A0ABC9YWI2_9NOCA|nr:hypothetical protein NS07_v2contig00060-0024 [Nocardia seriolae]GAP29752.1 hypothetical protein NSK11_contig00063-0023 [Nocardia seriolae]